MSSTVWHRSLSWRIGVGLVAFLALMLVAQGALFIYTSDRIAGSMPATSPRRLAMLVASDLSAALNTDPTIDIDEYVQDQYSNVLQPFIVLMGDGRSSSRKRPPASAPATCRRARQTAAATRWRRSPGRSTRWVTSSPAARGHSKRPTRRGASCWPTCRTS